MEKTNIHGWFRERLLRARLGLVLTLLLSGCGFHLRGMMAFPSGFNNVAIINQTQHISRDLILSLQRQLREHHINVVDDPSQKAQYWLVLEQDNLAQQLTNVAASTTPRQYQLIYTIQFQLAQANGATLVPSQAVSMQRQVTVNNDRILGSDFESQTIAHEIYQDAATQILTRISSRLVL